MQKNSGKGRGSPIRPPNRFGQTHAVDDLEHIADEEDLPRLPGTRFIPDVSRSVVSENDSPDVGFRFSVNPYRGCEHGCTYCYARPTHEYFGLSAGLDFETQIFVKERAPELFREWLNRPEWEPQPISFSGVTDCYQPAEREYRLTRGCLEVALEARQPVCIVTKNALVTRDLDILKPMAELNIVRVAISITTLDAELARSMEPRTSSPSARLRAVRELIDAGVPTIAMTAPVIPGLNDSEIPSILAAAKEAGAMGAAYVLLRLPMAVREVFLNWLDRTQPTRAPRVRALIQGTRDGKMNDSQFGRRMRGTGAVADQIRQTFDVFVRKYGLDGDLPDMDVTRFEPPRPASGQMRLF